MTLPNPDNKQIAVIILNWNGISLLPDFLPEAARYTISPEADLIVADNGSTDGSVSWIKEHCPQVTVLPFAENYGFAEGYNRAIEAAKDYPFTLLLNSDVLVTPGWLDPLLQYMQTHPQCAACQPKIRSYRERDKFEYAGAAGGLLDRNGYPFCRGRVFDTVETDTGQYDGEPREVAWASGAALLVRTELYQQVGGLDPLFFAHMEEIDLCIRLRAAGYGLVCVPDSVVYHVGGASLDQSNPRKTYLNFRNNLLLLHKNLPARRRRGVLLRRRLLDTLAWGMYILKGRWSHARAILKAHNDFRRMRRAYTAEPAADILPSLPGASRNIILDHFILHRPSPA